METNPSTVRSTKRRAELAAIAQKYGFKSWSAMLTAIKNGEAEIVNNNISCEIHNEPISKNYYFECGCYVYPPAPAGTIEGR